MAPMRGLNAFVLIGHQQISNFVAVCCCAGKKKESMFSVPEGVNAKVGVIGSGKAPTDYKAKSRHDFVATDDAE